MTPQPNMSELRKGKLGNISRANYKARRRLKAMPTHDDLLKGKGYGSVTKTEYYRRYRAKVSTICPCCGQKMLGQSVKSGMSFLDYNGDFHRASGARIHKSCRRALQIHGGGVMRSYSQSPCKSRYMRKRYNVIQ